MAHKKGDVLYYNLSISSINQATAGLPYDNDLRLAKAIVNSSNPILANPDEYYGSIVRLEFTGYTLPLIQFCVQTPVADINKGIYSFTLSYGATVSDQVFYTFKPQLLNPEVIIPTVGTPLQNFQSDYYNLYDYPWIVDIMNTALAAAFTDLQGKTGGALATAKVPFFYYNPKGLMELYVDAAFFDQSINTPVNIYFNTPSYVFMVAFTYINYAVNSPVGQDSLFIIKNINDINTVTISTTKYILQTQQYTSFEYMSALKSIRVITSMNVQSEAFNITGTSQNIDYSNVITDFLPDISQPSPGISSYKFIYNAPSLYRVFEFNQLDPLYEMSASIQWTDNFGNVHPFYNAKGQNVNIKFMFIKKSAFKFSLMS